MAVRMCIKMRGGGGQNKKTTVDVFANAIGTKTITVPDISSYKFLFAEYSWNNGGLNANVRCEIVSYKDFKNGKALIAPDLYYPNQYYYEIQYISDTSLNCISHGSQSVGGYIFGMY